MNKQRNEQNERAVNQINEKQTYQRTNQMNKQTSKRWNKQMNFTCISYSSVSLPFLSTTTQAKNKTTPDKISPEEE